MSVILRSMFFDDDYYEASDFVESNKNTYSDGILPNTEYFKVQPASGMTLAIPSGRGWCQGHSFVNSATAAITLDNADGVLSRIDRVVVRLDNSKTNGQQISVEVLKGALSATPTATALTRNGTVYEIALADVLINAGTTAITTAMITDKRTDINLCGWAGAFSAGQLNYDALDLAKADKSVVDTLISEKTRNELHTDVLNNPNYPKNYMGIARTATDWTKPISGKAYHVIYIANADDSGYGCQLATDYYDNHLYIRSANGLTWSNWQEINNATSLQGKAISTTAPTENQILKLISGVWTPKDSAKVVYGSGTFTSTSSVNSTNVSLGFVCTAYLCVTQSTDDTKAYAGSGSSVHAVSNYNQGTVTYYYIAIRE